MKTPNMVIPLLRVYRSSLGCDACGSTNLRFEAAESMTIALGPEQLLGVPFQRWNPVATCMGCGRWFFPVART